MHTLLIVIGSVLLVAIIHFYLLWTCYLAIMNLYRAKSAGTLSTFSKYAALPIYYFGLVLDFIGNAFWLMILCGEVPKEWLITTRLSRYKTYGSGYRYRFATLMCDNLLNPFDPNGCHCHTD